MSKGGGQVRGTKHAGEREAPMTDRRQDKRADRQTGQLRFEKAQKKKGSQKEN